MSYAVKGRKSNVLCRKTQKTAKRLSCRDPVAKKKRKSLLETKKNACEKNEVGNGSGRSGGGARGFTQKLSNHGVHERRCEA